MKNLIFVFACLFSVSVFGQTVYTQDQVVFNNDSTLRLDKSNNLPITGLLKEYHDNGQLSSTNNYTNGELEGLCKWYHENGQLSSKSNYKKGEHFGLFKCSNPATALWVPKLIKHSSNIMRTVRNL